jgi:hypothetical protein
MTRPSPLENVASAIQYPSDHRSLTPRTPHSRSGRAEEGIREAELEEVELEEIEQYRAQNQQSVPLLNGSSDNSFSPSGYRSRGDDSDYTGPRANMLKGLTLNLVLSRLPLVIAGLVAMFLFGMVWVAIKDPDGLDEILADNSMENGTFLIPIEPNDTVVDGPTAPDPATQPETIHISYENYTRFPLLGTEYRDECHKLVGDFTSHGNYWSPHLHGLMDVPHPDDHDGQQGASTKMCSSTITYQLDGNVGLLADLALMAQAAALAREVRETHPM